MSAHLVGVLRKDLTVRPKAVLNGWNSKDYGGLNKNAPPHRFIYLSVWFPVARYRKCDIGGGGEGFQSWLQVSGQM